MTALAAPRNTPIRAQANYLNRESYPMATATTIFAGALVALNAAGYLVNGSTATGLKAVGVLGDQPFEVPATSIVNAGANGAKLAEVLQNVEAKYHNSSSDPLTIADVTGPCYITDNQTVCKTASGKSLAGTVMAIDPDGGIWVLIGQTVSGVGPQGPQGPQGA